MKIGKNSIPGVFRWADGVIPEPGDYVLHQGRLWCVMSENPGKPGPENPRYTEYQSSDMISGIGELESILSGPRSGWPDKAVPVRLLWEFVGRTFDGLQGLTGTPRGASLPLSVLRSDTDHPCGVYTFSRRHKDLSGLVDQRITKPDHVLVKKYTVPGNRVVLEVLDYATGSAWVSTDGGPWKLVSPGRDIAGVVENLVGQYRARLATFEVLEERLKTEFRWTRLEWPAGKSPKILLTGTPGKGSKDGFPVIPGIRDVELEVVVHLTDGTTWWSGSVKVPADQDRVWQTPVGPHTVDVQIVSDTESLWIRLGGILGGLTASVGALYYQEEGGLR